MRTQNCKECSEDFESDEKFNEYLPKGVICPSCVEDIRRKKKKKDKFGLVDSTTILGYVFCTPDVVKASESNMSNARFAGVYKKKHVSHSI